jgi:hypothetical protein
VMLRMSVTSKASQYLQRAFAASSMVILGSFLVALIWAGYTA